MLDSQWVYTTDDTTHRARTIIGQALARVRATYNGMTKYQTGEAGPAIRGCLSYLEGWGDCQRPGDSDAIAVATALCHAACEIEARKGWPRLCDCPWPSWEDEVRKLYRSAESLMPGILAPDQRTMAGL